MCKDCKKEQKVRKIFIDDLPKKYGIGINKNKLVVDWSKSINYNVRFIYNNIVGIVKIVDYYKKNNSNHIKILFKNKIYSIATSQFLNCQLGGILEVNTKEYRYNIGDIIINVKSGKLKILEQIRIEDNGKSSHKGYKYKCLICGNEDKIIEYDLKNKKGCNVCSNQKVLQGYNDVATTNPYLASLFANKEDTYRYTEGSNQYIDFKCPDCDNIIKNKRISSVNKQGLSCPKCSDKIPYTEKFVFNILQQILRDNFIYQLTNIMFKWIDTYRYDFYFELNNKTYILETHGFQHYKNTGGCYKTIKEEQENDRLKKELAIKNGIKPKNYIVIDCRYSTLKWIKKHILESRLSELFDLSKIDWLKCHKFALSSLVKKACDYWVNGMYSTIKIGEIMKLNQTTIIRYLKQGKEINWCNYDSEEELIKSQFKKGMNSKKVIYLNTKKIFDSIKEASKYMNISASNISACCNNKYSYAGKNSITWEQYKWMYYEDYLKSDLEYKNYDNILEKVCDLWNNGFNNSKEIGDKLKLSRSAIIRYLKQGNKIGWCKYNAKEEMIKSNRQNSINNSKKVICLNNNKTFNSINEAANYYNISGSNISACCQNYIKSAGVDPKTEEYLQWQYYDDYLVKSKKLLSNDEINKFRKHSHINNRKIICMTTNKIFDTIADGAEEYNIDRAGITKCCQGKRNYAGKNPHNGEKLYWMYYDEYLKLNV